VCVTNWVDEPNSDLYLYVYIYISISISISTYIQKEERKKREKWGKEWERRERGGRQRQREGGRREGEREGGRERESVREDRPEFEEPIGVKDGAIEREERHVELPRICRLLGCAHRQWGSERERERET
jgi:hypothetical protein